MHKTVPYLYEDMGWLFYIDFTYTFRILYSIYNLKKL